MAEENKTDSTEDSKLVGLLAQFDDPDSLVAACDQARQAGYTKTDAYSPFPVHGRIDPALGIKRSILPFIVLAIALGAVVIGLGMQWYTNSDSGTISPAFPGYPFKISGKPEFSLPANIPVTFEVIVLSSAFEDEKFDRSSTEADLNGWGAVAIEECRQDLTDNVLPSWFRLVALLGALLLLIPPVVIFRSMGMTNRAPRLHFMPDMDWQEKSKTPAKTCSSTSVRCVLRLKVLLSGITWNPTPKCFRELKKITNRLRRSRRRLVLCEPV